MASGNPSKAPSILETIEAVLNEVEWPVAPAEVVDRVLARRSSAAKSARASVSNVLRYEMLGSHVVEQADGRLVRTADAMRGVRYRHAVDADERRSGRLDAGRCFTGYVKTPFRLSQLALEDEHGRTIAARPVGKDIVVAQLFGGETEVGLDVAAWMRDVRMAAGDHVIVTILDWDGHRYRLEREPAIRADRAGTARRNTALCDAFYEFLEQQAPEYVMTKIALPTAYQRLGAGDGSIGDHWLAAIRQDPRLDADVFAIRYGDALPGVAAHAAAGGGRSRRAADNRVFRLVVHRPGAQRARLRLEVLGGSTLFDVDGVLCDALRLDPWEHLRGFWRLVQRGDTKRVRKIEVATVGAYPEYCEGENQAWSAIAPSVGDRVRFVYDFGDWIEFDITVEAVGGEREAGGAYPRVVKGGKKGGDGDRAAE